MRYPLLPELEQLVTDKLVTKRPHPTLPLFVYNYSAAAQFKPIAEWTEALCDARGLILDHHGEIVGRPFRKFWNYEQVLDQIPGGQDYTVWEKVDGSLGIVCDYKGSTVVATRGSFESDQAKWAAQHFADFRPLPGFTYLFELIYPENRIVVDYGDRQETVLLAVTLLDGRITPNWQTFAPEWCQLAHGRRVARRYASSELASLAALEDKPEHRGAEGFVVRWDSGFQCKVKFAEYKRLHRLITQCSTRTIWELLRCGKGVGEVIDRVPDEFRSWVTTQTADLTCAFERISLAARTVFEETPGPFLTRRDFAEWAKAQPNPSLLFSLLDRRDITDSVWKLVEPKWATPFRKEPE